MPSSERVDLLACPRCASPLRNLRCPACGSHYQAPDGIPQLRIETDIRTEIVRRFYAQAPFPGYPPRDTVSALHARAGRSEFARALDAAIPADAIVAELGCGTGQLSLFLASGGRSVVGTDLSRPSLELAREAAARYGIAAHFVESDLHKPGLRRGAFDVVICTGVLHHCPSPRDAFDGIAPLVREGGVVVLGVYNALARIPLRIRRALFRVTGRVFGDPVLRERNAEPARREAWLRDQYLHPEEHRHTLGEVRRWFRENGVEYLRAFPSALFGGEPADLFAQSEDHWAPEALLSQLSWMWSLGHEGGLFAAIGMRRAAA